MVTNTAMVTKDQLDTIKEVGLEYARLGWDIRSAIDDYIRRKNLKNSPESILEYLKNHRPNPRGL